MPTEYSFTCATCDHPITGHPVFHIGLTFCCAGCAADGPCMCSYDAVEDDPPAIALLDEAEEPLVEPIGGRVFPEPSVREPAVAAVRDDATRLVRSGR
jgi:hypothetical protein